MTTIKIPASVSRTFHKAGMTIKKHSPEILMTVGVIGTVATTVLACKATLKVNEVLGETKTNLDKIHTATETGVTEAGEEYTVEDSKKDLAITYAQTGVKLAKLYGPAIGLGTLSIAAILTSNGILHKRTAAAVAAYTAVDKGFKEYRGRVIDRFGKELDRELKYGIKAVEVEETVTNEDGTETTVKKTIETVRSDINYSPYAIFYDDGNTGWDKDPEVSKFFLIQQQNFANEKLKAQGYLFLNDVYKMLGAKPTKTGQQVGWIYDEKNPIGDNFVDFGIFDTYKQNAREFVNGYERVIILDFNVDGNILDYFA